MASRLLKKPFLLLYLGAFMVIVYFVVTGSSYYLTELGERPRHPDYWALKPGGDTGHALGIAGSALMVVMLLYSVRKRVGGTSRLGPTRVWLKIHIFCGIVGPLLVILHTSFKVQGLVALSFWSMIVVALSGFVGRYLYVQVPRRRSGDELSLNEVEEMSRELSRRLTEEFQVSESLQAKLTDLSTDDEDRRGLIRVFLRSPWERVALRRRLKKLVESEDSPHELVAELIEIILQKITLERRIHMWNEIHRLFFYWHVFHKPFAVIMYLFMIVHIAVAIATGYGGLLGG